MQASDTTRRSTAELDFEAFYRAEASGQVRRAALLTGSDELANDIVHNALAAMYKRWDTIDDHGSYLNRSVLNGCRDLSRRRVTHRRLISRLRAERTSSTDRPYLADALSRLPFNQRAAIVLRYYAGYSTSDIARALDCPAGSVGPWIERGLAALRRELQ